MSKNCCLLLPSRSDVRWSYWPRSKRLSRVLQLWSSVSHNRFFRCFSFNEELSVHGLVLMWLPWLSGHCPELYSMDIFFMPQYLCSFPGPYPAALKSCLLWQGTLKQYFLGHDCSCLLVSNAAHSPSSLFWLLSITEWCSSYNAWTVKLKEKHIKDDFEQHCTHSFGALGRPCFSYKTQPTIIVLAYVNVLNK